MSDSASYDVIIIGGGLAGLSSAILLARKGHRVLVLEKEDYPRHKVCGEYISMESKPFLQSLGVPVDDPGLPVINRLQITDDRGRALDAALPQGGFGISRFRLDAALAGLAIEAGVEVRTKIRADQVHYSNNCFTVEAKDHAFTARTVCGTWGKRSNMDVKWQRPFTKVSRSALDNHVGIKYHIKTDWPNDCVGLHNFAGGYCGISPIEDGSYCLCYLTTAASLQQNGNDIKSLEQNVLMRNPVLAAIFRQAEFLYDAPLAISQISFSKKEQVHDHVLLLGDAAGMITPLCGNGMSMALHAAKIAAGHLDDFLQRRTTQAEMEASYTASWRSAFSTRLAAGRAVQTYFGKDVATRFFIGAFRRLPFLRAAVINSTSGNPF